jgi:demethoxyubiquinone hydroxylase (CLK1/Coq7/Cat5 family)
MVDDRPDKPLTVFFDGACPLCEREIGFYRRRPGAGAIGWVDINRCEGAVIAPGLSRADALARFHVLDADGSLVSGGAAFARLWEALPGFRWLGRLCRTAPIAWLLERGYDQFLKARPALQSLVRRRDEPVRGALPAWLVRDLRSDHAGETGALAIYRGILAVSRDEETCRFAAAHLETEREHLRLLETVLPRRERSRLLWLWRWAGCLTGAIPALLGPRCVFATIAAVETFVDRHYAAQIHRLGGEASHAELKALLERCRQDEARHRDEARQALGRPAGPIATVWGWLVGAGSAAAVGLARRL